MRHGAEHSRHLPYFLPFGFFFFLPPTAAARVGAGRAAAAPVFSSGRFLSATHSFVGPYSFLRRRWAANGRDDSRVGTAPACARGGQLHSHGCGERSWRGAATTARHIGARSWRACPSLSCAAVVRLR